MFKKKEDLICEDSKNLYRKLVVITIFLIWVSLIYSISNILIILFFALFLNLLFSPFLNYLNSKKIWDLVWMLIIYFLLAAFMFLMFFAIVPIFVKQISLFTDMTQNWVWGIKTIYEQKWVEWFALPSYAKYILSHIDIKEILESIKNNASEIWRLLWNNLKNFLINWAWLLGSFTSALINTVLVLIFSFFIALERKDVKSFFYKNIPTRYADLINSKESKIIDSLSAWLKWQMILSVSIFLLTIIWLLILRLFWVHIDEFATLAVIAAMMEFIPFFWPFLALLPALMIAIVISWKAFIAVLILYILIQQTENNILVPYVMWKTLSLSPFAVMLAMMIWASLFWIVWIIMAVPIVSIIQIFYTDKK